MFWFDKQNPHVLYCDNRELECELCDGRKFKIKPDVLCDFRQLPFEDETFWHVVFDPPHITQGGDSAWIIKKYGKLPKEWGEYLKLGFDECWRVLKINGTMVFKWNEDSITVGEIIKAIGREPLYGHKSGRTAKTHWLCFIKVEEN